MTEVVLDNLDEAMLIFDDSTKNLIYSNPASKELFASAVDHVNEDEESREDDRQQIEECERKRNTIPNFFKNLQTSWSSRHQ